tara:strand:+ start:279 stop:470 length:192 start_codon:yes stop_codon:yes gene_type:complete
VVSRVRIGATNCALEILDLSIRLLDSHHAFLALLTLVVLDLSVGKLGPNKTLAVFMCALKVMD